MKRVAVAVNIDRVKTLYEEQPKISLRATARDLQLSYRSLRVILKEDLKMKLYKIHRCQELTSLPQRLLCFGIQHLDKGCRYERRFILSFIAFQKMIVDMRFSNIMFIMHQRI